jgi:hypothetical protein
MKIIKSEFEIRCDCGKEFVVEEDSRHSIMENESYTDYILEIFQDVICSKCGKSETIKIK